MTAVIAIELQPVEASSPQVRSMLESCELAARGRARCVPTPADGGTEEGRGEKAELVAVVTWDGAAHLRAELAAGVLVGGTAMWRSRVIEFDARDPEEERWRSLGFAVATLFGDDLDRAGGPVARGSSTANDAALATKETAPAAAPVPARTSSAAESDATPTQERPSHPGWWLSARLSAGGGLPGVSPAFGGSLGLARPIDRVWFVDGALAFDTLTLDAYRLVIVRPSVSLGAGAMLRISDRFRTVLDGHVMLERVEVQGTLAGESDVDGRWVTGLRQSVDVEWSASYAIWVTMGGTATETSGATNIQVRQQDVARLAPIDVAAEVGVRIAVP